MAQEGREAEEPASGLQNICENFTPDLRTMAFQCDTSCHQKSKVTYKAYTSISLLQRMQIDLLRRRRLAATETEEIQENPADNKGKELEVRSIKQALHSSYIQCLHWETTHPSFT